jgi:shikimate dehydrogenase
MDRYCVMGNPVAHSRSPWIHARFAELTGQTLAYERQLAPLDGFAATVQAFRSAGGRGCNVTVPFKHEAAALASWQSPGVTLAGAANTLHFDGDAIRAHNTDGHGLVADITRNAGVALAGRDVLLIGAGGAAAGVLGPLIGQRPRRIVIANRTRSRADALVQRHAALASSSDVALQACGLDLSAGAGASDAAALAGGFDVVINATASSLGGAAVPVPPSVLKPGALALDMMYGPAAMPFMNWAAAHGALPRDGLGMLVEQAAESFLIWRGVRPPSATVLAELRAIVDGGRKITT